MTATEDRPGWIDAGRVPGLDGLRGVAVGLVVAAHAAPPGSWLFRRGATGVDVFFVLSGFLITLLMLRERDRTGRVDLRAFYLRRALRIWPAYYAFLAFVAIVGGPSRRALLVAAGFLTGVSYRWPEAAGVAQTWTLTAEELFYLAWPALFAALGGRAAWGMLAASPLVRWAARAGLFTPGAPSSLFAPARMDGLALGCLLALAVHRRPAILRAAARWRWPLLLACLAALHSWDRVPSWTLRSHGRRPAEALATAGLVLACLAPGWPARVLGWRPLVGLGVLSYSLYLWHPLFVGEGEPLSTGRLGVDLGLSLACALASYFLVERPFLRLKDRLRA